MRRPTLAFFSALVLLVVAASSARAQSNASADATQPAGQTSATNSSTPAPAQPAAKKVWTNDDVTDLRSESTISTVGAASAKTAKTGEKGAAASKGKNAGSYQSQIAKLKAQIPRLDSQIAELQAAINGKPTGDARTSRRPSGVKEDDWSVELAELQKKRDDIKDQIGVLEDQARHQGGAGNTLP